LHLFVLEGLLLGVCGAVAGLVIGYALAHLISFLGIPMPPPPGRDFGYSAEITLTARLAWWGVAIAVLPATLASLYPAWKAARVGFLGLISNGRGELPIVGEGIEPDREARIGSAISMLEGRNLTAGDTFGIMVGEGLAHALKLKVGDSVNLVLATREGAMNT